MLSGVIDVFAFRYTRDGLLLFPRESRDNSQNLQLQNLPVPNQNDGIETPVNPPAQNQNDGLETPVNPPVPNQNEDLGNPDASLFSRRWAVGECSLVKAPFVMFS